MDCPRCRAATPEVAHFCQRCGNDLRSSDDVTRRRAFAVKPDESVASFALISTIMPEGAKDRPQTYKIGMLIALTVALVAAIFGALPIAILVAAFAIPIIYIVYIYDVNLWEDEPVLVTLVAFVASGVLGAVFTILWTGVRGPTLAVGGDGGASPAVGGFLLAGVLVPIVAMVITQLSTVFLASRKEFDDLMDGLTFGVIAGVAYSTGDTLVRQFGLLTGGLADTRDAGTWAGLIFLEGFLKPLIFGTAAGIAGAEFSGLGKGYDGFTARYWRGLGGATIAVVLYSAFAYLLSFVGGTLGVFITIAVGLLILASLIIVIRNVMHTGLLEAALEAAAREGEPASAEISFCRQCEMPLVSGAAFCNNCGTAVLHTRRGAPPSAPPPAGQTAAATPVPVPSAPDAPQSGEARQ